MYEVVWVRSLSLIFGGTHLAVTTVLSVFMGGLALGSFLIGKRVDAIKNPLKFFNPLPVITPLQFPYTAGNYPDKDLWIKKLLV